jgi:hypothetical protein
MTTRPNWTYYDLWMLLSICMSRTQMSLSICPECVAVTSVSIETNLELRQVYCEVVTEIFKMLLHGADKSDCISMSIVRILTMQYL